MFIYHHIVDPSAYIARSRSCSITPPGIVIKCFWVKITSHIETVRVFYKWSDLCSLYREKSYRVFIFLRSCDIDRSMDDIEVSCYDGLKALWLQRLYISDDLIIKIEFITEHLCSISSRSSVGKISVDDLECVDSNFCNPTIIMKEIISFKDIITWKLSEFLFVKNGRTSISWSRTSMPDIIVVIGQWLEWSRYLMVKCFRFLDTNNIQIICPDSFYESFVSDSTNSIHISSGYFHGLVVYQYKIILIASTKKRTNFFNVGLTQK